MIKRAKLFWSGLKVIAPWIVLAELLLLIPAPAPLGYIAMLNWLGPSTEYHNPSIGVGERGKDGRWNVFLGEEFFVWITIVRHARNGNCIFDIERYAEATEEPNAGQRRLISSETLQFIGQNDLRTTRWPQPPAKIILNYEVDDDNNPITSKPLLPDGVDEQEFEFYVRGRYYCNVLDYIFPRYIQGNVDRPNETARVRAVIKRYRT